MNSLPHGRKGVKAEVPSGRTFGRWTVIRELETEGRQRRFLVVCACGREKAMFMRYLTSGASTRCGSCSKKRDPDQPYIEVEAGAVFGSWTVLQETEKRDGERCFLCRCACGAEGVVSKWSLTSGENQRCRRCGYANRPGHGHCRNEERSLTYVSWGAMKDRCSRPECNGYERYGGRGIKVCERWQSFENFLADMGERPSAAHTIERENSDGDYTPDNCRWATKSEQQKNREVTHLITANGRTLSTAEWARELGMDPRTLHQRLKAGWSEERAVSTPLDRTRSHQRG